MEKWKSVDVIYLDFSKAFDKVLGPLLFLVLIGDIDEGVVSSFLSSFADDTRISHGISSQDDTEALKQDLHAVYLWAKKNNMEFNSDKFEHLRYSHQGYPPTETIYQADNDQEIDVKSSLRDPGVTMSDDASFSTYIREKVSAMKLKVGWDIRTFERRDK